MNNYNVLNPLLELSIEPRRQRLPLLRLLLRHLSFLKPAFSFFRALLHLLLAQNTSSKVELLEG
jgi:hypothetical protein